MAKKNNLRSGAFNPTPVTRLEKFLAAIAGLVNAPTPVTRKEYWMSKTAARIKAIEEGGGGGGTEYTAGYGIEISENNEISVNENEVALKDDTEIIQSDVWTIWKNNNTKTIIAIAVDTLFSKIDISSGSLYMSDWHELIYPEELKSMPPAKLTTMYVAAYVSTYSPEEAIFATDAGQYTVSGERRIRFRITSGARSQYDEIYAVGALIICRFSD